MRRASERPWLSGWCLCVSVLPWLLYAGSVAAQERGWIGVELQDVGSERARQLGLEASTGSYVTATRRGGGAEQSGLAAGDVILDLDGQAVGDTKAAVLAIQARVPGTIARVTVWRDTAKLTVALTIGQAPEVLGLVHQIEALGRSGKQTEVAALADTLEASVNVLPGLSPNERAQAFERMAYALQELSQYARAETFRRRVLEIRQSQHGASHPATAAALSNLADSIRRQKRYQEALGHYGRALAIVEAVQGRDHIEHAWVLSRSGDSLYYLGRYAEAETFYRRALAIREKQHGADHAMVARPLGDLADTLRAAGRYAEAAEFYERKIAVVERAQSPDQAELGNTLNWLATTLRYDGRYLEGEKAARRAVEIHEKAGLEEKLGWSRFEVAGNLRYQFRLEEAQREFASSMKILLKALPVGDTRIAAVMFGQIHIFLELARYAEAETTAREMLALREQGDGPEHYEVARALEMVGFILRVLDRSEEAEPLLRRALAIRERLLGSDHHETTTALIGLAWILYDRSNYEEAGQLNERVLAIRERVFGSEHLQVADSLELAAAIMRYTGREAEAVPVARRRLAILERSLGPDDPTVAKALNSLGLLSERTGKTVEAAPLYERALAIRLKTFGEVHPDVAWNYNRLGLLAEGAKRWPEALEHYRKATTIVSRRALDIQRRDRTLYDEAEQTRYVYRNLVDAAYEVALAQPELGPDLLDEAFRAAQWRARTQTSEALLQMSARLGIGDATLAGLVREGQDLRTRWAAAERKQVQAAGRATGSGEEAGREFSAISKRLDEISAEVARRNPAFADLASSEPITIEAARGHLRDDEVLVFFLQTGSDTYVWALTRNAVLWQRLGLGQTSLGKTIGKLRCGLDRTAWYPDGGDKCRKLVGAESVSQEPGTELPFDMAAAHELYNDLFGPIADLTNGRHLLIVASGPLAQLPFQVLVIEPPVGAGTEAYKSAAWLGHRQPISVLPAVSALKALREDARASRATKPLVSFANPILDGPGGPMSDLARAARAATACSPAPRPSTRLAATEGRSAPAVDTVFRGAAVNLAHVRALAPLPETVDEACALARSVGATNADLWFASRATEANLKALSESGQLADYRVLHFATHGLVSGGADELQVSLAEPALVFTPPPDAQTPQALAVDDGLLMASEVSALRLDADWVILSACNTAAGKASGAEALSGLARAFLYAGARALLVSHWEVDSHAAVQLVTGAYAALRDDPKIGRADALRRSIVSLAKRATDPHHAHPMYWGPFVVIGEGGK